jgi:hypothetical protein
VRLRLYLLDTCILEIRTGDDPEPDPASPEPGADQPPAQVSNHSGVFELGFVRDYTMADLPDMPESRRR